MIKQYLRLAKDAFYTVKSRITGKSPFPVEEDDKNSPCIVYISETNMPRLERMLVYLQPLRNEKLILICNRLKFKEAFFTRIKGVSIYLVDNTWEIGEILSQLKHVKIIHALESRSLYPYFALKNKAPETRFIFDYQDLYNNYTADKSIPNWMRENIYFEKACLKNSDAFIGYSLELNPLRRRLKLKKMPSIYFPFYADDEAICAPKVKQRTGNEIHMVYAGGIAAIDKNISFNLTLTADHLAHSNVYLHVYPSPSIESDIIQQYKKYGEKNSNLVLHNTVSNKELSQTLQQYDYALIPFFKTDSYKAPDKYKYSTALKIWNFIEAGLPILIMADVEYQAWLISRLHAGIVIKDTDINKLPTILNQCNVANFIAGIQATQTDYKLSKNIYKIENLYNQLLSQKSTQ